MEPVSEESFLKYDKYLPTYNFEGVTEDMVCFKQFRSQIKCSVCLLIMNHPITLSCGHSFCKNCAVQCTKCPLCKTSFSRNPFPSKNIALAEIIDNQEIVCPSVFYDVSYLSCGVTGLTIKDIESHVKKCGFILLKCQCGILLPRNSFLKTDSKCKCALIPCEFCSQSYQKRLLSFHSDICRKSKVLCEKCGIKYTRENKTRHIEKECFISCPFAQTGCTNKVKPQELEQHLKNADDYHGMMILKNQFPEVFTKLISIREEMKNKVTKLNSGAKSVLPSENKLMMNSSINTVVNEIRIFIYYKGLYIEKSVALNQTIGNILEEVVKEVKIENSSSVAYLCRRSPKIRLKEDVKFLDYNIQNNEIFDLLVIVEQ
mgnify:FL=1